MGNIKEDLFNELLLQKNYAEQELVRLSKQPITMPYQDIINGMLYRLEELALLDTKMNYVDKYFVEQKPEQQNQNSEVNNNPQQAPQPAPEPQPAPQPINEQEQQRPRPHLKKD
ncbi:MAG: hypothetical protein ACOCVF_00165 [bacterium]